MIKNVSTVFITCGSSQSTLIGQTDLLESNQITMVPDDIDPDLDKADEIAQLTKMIAVVVR